MTMKENQNPTSYDSPAFGSEEVFEMKVSDEKCKDIGDISTDNETRTIDSKRMEYQNGLSDLAGIQEKGLHLLSFDTRDKDEKLVTAEEHKTPCEDLLETVTNVFTDKNVLECELSELEVMKDICVDDGTHEMKVEKDCNSVDQEKLIASSVSSSEKDTAEHCDLPELQQAATKYSEDDSSVSLSEKDTAEHCDLTELQQAATKYSEDDSLVDKKHPVQEASAMVLLGSFPDSSDGEVKKPMQPTDQVMKDICVDDGMPEIRGDEYEKSVDQERQVAFSVSSSETDTAEHCDLPELEQEGTKYSEDDSVVDKKHPVQEAGALVLIESFPYTSDGEAKKIELLTDQIEVGSNSDPLTQNSPIENAVAVSATSSSPELSELKGNIQAGSILFNRNIPSGRITFNFSDTEHNNTTLDLNEQPSDSSATRNHHSTKDDAQVVDSKLQYDRGETSFSTITYSDPVVFSRSLSHRSDASTTSTRSFAFPVLQSEWNSSPVRMAKPDRRHFRRQKGWRSGLLCCRF